MTINNLAKQQGTAIPDDGNCDEVKEALKGLSPNAGADKALCIETVSVRQGRSIPSAKKAKLAEILAFPQWCWDNAYGDLWKMMDRRLACRWSTKGVKIVDSKGKEHGHSTFDRFDLISAHSTAPQFSHQQALMPSEVDIPNNKITVAGGFSCVGWCSYGDQDYPLQTLDTNDLVEGSRVFYTTVKNQGEVGTIDTRLDMVFGAPGVLTLVVPVHGSQVRCDNAVPGMNSVGCVNALFPPTFQYSKSGPYSELAKHIELAQESGIPGAPGGVPLHRLVNPKLQVKNRNQSCPDRFNRPPGNSCDEYPMATTYEGGWTKGDLTVTESSPMPSWPWTKRTFPMCATPGVTWPLYNGIPEPDGLSACMINETHNSQGGNALNNELYRPQRIINMDPFFIEIVP
ncbi:hypothetical protein HUT06_21490 [Actinomadura sp. NAK00032]|uniref:hypothetical protein n=1 Tax=Actinomadura sp. NAK00032 TaxID=2742128 RepID=UPI00158FF5FA|nr:hypothetical protein [Actinomadura sp. NAK00032]QKW36286.1 hypothetical protein HUT06_21490 [Actinomadura sp. NAK00032]